MNESFYALGSMADSLKELVPNNNGNRLLLDIHLTLDDNRISPGLSVKVWHIADLSSYFIISSSWLDEFEPCREEQIAVLDEYQDWLAIQAGFVQKSILLSELETAVAQWHKDNPVPVAVGDDIPF